LKYGFGRGKMEEGFWDVTKKEGKDILKIKFYAKEIMSFWGVTRIIQDVIKETLNKQTIVVPKSHL